MRTRALVLCVATMSALAGVGATASANTVSYFDTVFGTDYAAFGYGGMRGVGSGTIAVAGVSGTVERAILTWHGPTNSSNPLANATVTFNGTSITGTNIGISQDNNWGFANSQAYSADVTALVSGNGNYGLAGFTKPGVEINGVTLEVFFDDGDNTNDRDIVLFHGNDSNIPNAFDPVGWQAALNGIDYSGGAASLLFGVSDGQNFGNDERVLLNGVQFIAVGPNWQGNSTPAGPGGASNGKLWDLKSFDLAGFLSPGVNNLSLTTDTPLSDALSLVHLAFNLPAGAAPPVPEPATLFLLGLGAAAVASRRARR